MHVVTDDQAWLHTYKLLTEKHSYTDGDRRLLVSYQQYISAKSIEEIFYNRTGQHPFGRVFVGYTDINGSITTHAIIDLGCIFPYYTQDYKGSFDYIDSDGCIMEAIIKTIDSQHQLVDLTSLLLGLQEESIFTGYESESSPCTA